MRYEIVGETLPAVICTLEEGETMITEKGAMSWMSPNMKMETSTNGGIGKAFGRMFSGESIFQNTYTAKGGHGMIAFASSFPGKITSASLARFLCRSRSLARTSRTAELTEAIFPTASSRSLSVTLDPFK